MTPERCIVSNDSRSCVPFAIRPCAPYWRPAESALVSFAVLTAARPGYFVPPDDPERLQ